jgi:DNA polymerase-1
MNQPDYDVVVFDASNAIHRISAANPPLHNRAGEPVEVVFGFLRLLSAVLRENTAKECILIWDTKTSRLIRQKIDPLYKARRGENRSEADVARINSMYPQVDRFWKQFGQHLPVTWVESPMYEADDIMSMYAHVGWLNCRTTLIVTGDKDILQCVNPWCSVYSPNSGKICTKDNFSAYTGGYPTPEAYLLGKCLQGEEGDCIPGIPGIGEKRALSILSTHDWNLDELKNRPIEALSKTKWGKELAKDSSWKRVSLNYKLMNLLAPLHQCMRMIQLTVKPGVMNKQELRLALARNQFASIIVDWNKWISPFEILEKHAGTATE